MLNEIESAEADRLEAESDALAERAAELRSELEEVEAMSMQLYEQAQELRCGPLVAAVKAARFTVIQGGKVASA